MKNIEGSHRNNHRAHCEDETNTTNTTEQSMGDKVVAPLSIYFCTNSESYKRLDISLDEYTVVFTAPAGMQSVTNFQ